MISGQPATQIIKMLNQVDESRDVEAKEISGIEIGKSFFETVCSFANEPEMGGGTILLGVKKQQQLFAFYDPVGVTDPDKITLDIASGCSSKFNVPIRVNIIPELVGDKVIIRVDVPELSGHQKPVYLKAVGLPRGAFRRVGSTDVRCVEEDLLTFYHGKNNQAFDSHLIQDALLEDIDPASIIAYRKARRELNAFAPELEWSDEELLYAVGGLRKIDGKLKVTATGILVFGKSSAVRRLFPMHRVDYIRVTGKTWISDVENRFESIDMRGSIITLIPRIIAAIADDLPKAFGLDETGTGQRTDIPLLPMRVIREVVVNALMHRNYQTYEPIQIIRYSNRLIIKNPGFSLKSQEQFDDPGSISRNPNVAGILHDTRFAENKGSGIRVMRDQLRENGLSIPTFDSDRDHDLFSAIFLFHHFLNEEDWRWLKKFRRHRLSEEQMRALVFVREVGRIDNSAYRSLTNSDTLGASRSLQKLRKANLLTMRGSAATVYYEAGPALLDMLRDSGATIEPRAATIEPPPYGKDGQPTDPVPVIRVEDLPLKLRRSVQHAALGRRMAPDIARGLILELCEWRPMSALQISGLLEKTTSHIAQTYLYPMVKEGVLRHVHEDMKHHPEQMYAPKAEHPATES